MIGSISFEKPTKETYAGHDEFIMETDLKKFYDTLHPQLAQFVSDAIKVFCRKEFLMCIKRTFFYLMVISSFLTTAMRISCMNADKTIIRFPKPTRSL